ncbi:MAG TPA: hypothetical protein VII58_00595 [Acidobacteriaceae bacterium]
MTYELLFDFDAVAHAEELTNSPLLTGLDSKSINTPKISTIQNMLFACLIPLQPKITLAEAKALVTRKTYRDVWSIVLNAWVAGLAEPEPDEDAPDADPQPGQSAPMPVAG